MKTDDTKKVQTFDEIVEEIKAISDGVQRLLNSKLSRRAILVLIHDSIRGRGYGYTKPSKGDIEEVLTAAGELKNVYVKKLKDAPKTHPE